MVIYPYRLTVFGCIHTNKMNIELNTPRTLKHTQEYISEITGNPVWNQVGPYAQPTGWKPGNTLRKHLIYQEIGYLTRDILQNNRRIRQWKQQLTRETQGETREKLVKMIRKWGEYTRILGELRDVCKNAMC